MIERIKKSVFTAPLLVLIVGLLTVLSGKVLNSLTFSNAEELFLTYIVADLLIFVLPGIIYVKLKPRGYTTEMNLISFGFSKLPLAFLVFFVMAFGSVLVNLLFAGKIAADSGLSQSALQIANGDYISDPRTVVYVSLTLGIVPAFAEEFVFRGILLSEYKNYGMLPSVLVTSLLFAMLHFDLKLFPLYFVSGLALGTVAYTTRSAFISAILHSMYNLFSLFALPLVMNFLSMEAGVLVFYLTGVAFLFFLMLSLGEAEKLFRGYSSAGIRSPALVKRENSLFSPVFEILSPSFLVCVLLFVLGALQIIRIPA